MAVATKSRKKKPREELNGQLPREFGPASAGILMTPEEFDEAEFKEGWRYELIHGVLVVSSRPLESERDPNEELGRMLRNYQEYHSRGKSLDKTLPEQIVRVVRQRRAADRVVWAGLGRRPRRFETPTIVVEFVSRGKRDRYRDYEEKRVEYLAIGVKEYWVIDRFQHQMSVYKMIEGKFQQHIVNRRQSYKTELLPGFTLPLAKLFDLADEWPETDDDDE